MAIAERATTSSSESTLHASAVTFLQADLNRFSIFYTFILCCIW